MLMQRTEEASGDRKAKKRKGKGAEEDGSANERTLRGMNAKLRAPCRAPETRSGSSPPNPSESLPHR